ncbi:hypothetical protein FOS10_35145, partial [Bacillus thuringiensis]|nr:hypothetical protein [Bacillus thuringiensis]
SKEKEVRLCSIEGCTDKHYGKGYCSKHYRMNRKTGSPISPSEKIRNQGCSIEGCDNEHRAKGYCSKHYQYYHKKGLIQ